jgi:hypothetical protein
VDHLFEGTEPAASQRLNRFLRDWGGLAYWLLLRCHLAYRPRRTSM